MIKLGVAIFNGDHCNLGNEIKRCEDSGADFIHWDVFDGHFLPDLGFPARTIKTARNLTKLPFYIHLGVNNPLSFVPGLVDAGADVIYLPFESCILPYEVLFNAKQYGVKIGFSLSIGTPVELLKPLLPYCDNILLLTRVISESKTEPLQTESLNRISTLKELIIKQKSQVEIEVAGSMTPDMAKYVIDLGGDAISYGSNYYKIEDPVEFLKEQRKILSSYSASRKERWS